MNNGVTEISQLHQSVKTGNVLNAVIGISLFLVGVYAFSLSIKVNKLSLKKLKDEGYE